MFWNIITYVTFNNGLKHLFQINNHLRHITTKYLNAWFYNTFYVFQTREQVIWWVDGFENDQFGKYLKTREAIAIQFVR